MPRVGPELTQACHLHFGRLRHRAVPQVSEVPATTVSTTTAAAAAAPTLTSTTSASPHTVPTVVKMTENMALLTISCHISSISGLKSGDQWLLFSRQSLFASTNTFTYTSLNNTVYIKHLLCILPLSLQGAMPLEHL